MENDEIIFGYIPPNSYSFASMKEAIGALVAALTSLECARFMQFIETHSGNKNNDLARFLPAYTLADWSRGQIDPRAWTGREKSARDGLQRWAFAMIEINTFFRRYQIENPIMFLEEKNLIKRSEDDFGWSSVRDEIETFLGISLGQDDEGVDS